MHVLNTITKCQVSSDDTQSPDSPGKGRKETMERVHLGTKAKRQEAPLIIKISESFSLSKNNKRPRWNANSKVNQLFPLSDFPSAAVPSGMA